MSGPKRSFDEKAKAISGTLLIVTGVFAAITQLSDQLREFFLLIPKLGPTLYPVLAILLILGVWALWDGLARRSRLLLPEALLLKADKTEHLAGRSEDIDRLSKLCTDYQQVQRGTQGKCDPRVPLYSNKLLTSAISRIGHRESILHLTLWPALWYYSLR